MWFVQTKTPLQTDALVDGIFSKKDLSLLHNTLILFWRYFCKARSPQCGDCRFQKICHYNKKQEEK
jgi:endonuclease-3